MSSTTSTTDFTREQPASQTCYKHPKRETNVSCSSCGRPICTDCMTPSPVGMRCPECAGERTQVITASQVTNPSLWATAKLTSILIGINAVVFVAELLSGYPLGLFPTSLHGWVVQHGVFYGPLIAGGDWWRVITSGFIHFGLMHIAFNMYLLYVLGRMLEPAIGSLRYGLVYITSLLAGSLGTMILSPSTPSAGASGAIFGLMAALAVVLKVNGARDMGGLGIVIVMNLVFTFTVPGISIGGHLGGIVGGALVGLLIEGVGVYRKRQGWLVWAGVVVLLALGTVIGIAAAGR